MTEHTFFFFLLLKPSKFFLCLRAFAHAVPAASNSLACYLCLPGCLWSFRSQLVFSKTPSPKHFLSHFPQSAYCYQNTPDDVFPWSLSVSTRSSTRRQLAQSWNRQCIPDLWIPAVPIWQPMNIEGRGQENRCLGTLSKCLGADEVSFKSRNSRTLDVAVPGWWGAGCRHD